MEESILQLEIEQWCIFIEWNVRYEAGDLDAETHPGHGGLDPRWDDLESILKSSRPAIPAHARKALAKYERIERTNRYEVGGPGYRLKWCILLTAKKWPNNAVKPFVASLLIRTLSTPRQLAHGFAIVARSAAPSRAPLTLALDAENGKVQCVQQIVAHV